MSGDVRIAIDAMGGDHGPPVMVDGAAEALSRRPETRFLFFGREAEIAPLVAARPALAARATIRHTDVAVAMTDKPSQALRTGRRVSSMWQAIEAVKKGEADLALSAGNTGALMAMAKVCLRTTQGIDRPVIAALWPTLRGRSVVLDVGAGVGAEARSLVETAIMGAAMARVVLALDRPSVGLLNVGTEEIKGLDEVKEASRLLREGAYPGLDYRGFVEGDDLGKGTVDVVVTDGFTGNVALKTAEGTARQIRHYLREAMGHSWRSRLAYLVGRPAFDRLRSSMDPRTMNGGVFLGLDGIVIKSHGGMDALGTANAIELGHAMVRHQLLGKIRDMLAASLETEAASAATTAREPAAQKPAAETAARIDPT